MFIEVDTDEHAEDAENIDFNVEPYYEFDQNQVYGKGRADAGSEMSGEDALNGALRRHDVENFPKYSAK